MQVAYVQKQENLMHETTQRILTAIPLTLFFGGIIIFAPTWAFIPIIACLLAIMLIVEWPKLMPINTPYFALITMIYPILPVLLILAMHLQTGPITTTYLVSAVALHDCCSYFVGKAWGKTKILPSISPGKTIQGFFGGLYATLFFNTIFLMNKPADLLFVVLLSIGFCMLAFLGDIFESYLKRRAGLKDSGTILPGHGGIFDRIDGILFAIFLVYPYQYHLYEILTK